MRNTYSFGDVSLTISHPAVGQIVTSGAGLGNITTVMAGERTAHEISADGTTMISKIKNRSGSHTIAIQQTSDLNKWLLRLFNYLENAPSSQWADTTIVQRAPSLGDLITSTGVSFQKLPDKPYQAQGQQITWNLMAADIQQDVI